MPSRTGGSSHHCQLRRSFRIDADEVFLQRRSRSLGLSRLSRDRDRCDGVPSRRKYLACDRRGGARRLPSEWTSNRSGTRVGSEGPLFQHLVRVVQSPRKKRPWSSRPGHPELLADAGSVDAICLRLWKNITLGLRRCPVCCSIAWTTRIESNECPPTS